jgi:uncharacterized protein GlcG (DUF336 family)
MPCSPGGLLCNKKKETQMVNLEVAKKLIEAAEKKAREIHQPMVIAVVDAGANLVALHRMDGAFLVSLEIAKQKAYTSVAIQMPTHEVAPLVQPGASLYGLNTTDNMRIVPFGGGFPLRDRDGAIVGGIGVSGGSVEQDMACAEAGVKAFK